MTDSVIPPCSDCDRFIVGEAWHLRLRLVCSTCNKPLLLNDRYEFMRKLSGSWDANAEVFTVSDNQEPNVQKILKVLTNQELHVLKLFKIEQLILMELDHPGIPKGYDAFEVKAPDEQVIPCVVMERIQGDTLQEYLNTKGTIDQVTAIDWMTQLLGILDYVHRQELFHRDIKPTNIMRRSNGKLVLIDFGTARHVTQTIVNGGNNTVVYSHGYTAPEQMAGKAEVRSDFYALGRTFQHLMMGELPSDWKTFVSKQPISPLFQTILQNLTKPNASDRPKSTRKILRDLKRIKNEPQRKRLKDLSFSFVGGTLLGVALISPWVKLDEIPHAIQEIFPTPACSLTVQDNISCGEEILITELEPGKNQPTQKAQAVEKMKAGLFHEAENLFQQSFNEQMDPETLIYWNNAKIHNNPELSRKKTTIAVIVPVGGEANLSRPRALAILRGAAQAQKDALENLKIGLTIAIVNDDNKPKVAEKSAALIVDRNIIGGIGHASSDALALALPVYKKRNLAFIAPTSTSENFTSYASTEGHVFFRTLPRNSVNARYMVELIRDNLKQKKLAIYFTPGSSYSESLETNLRQFAGELGIDIVTDNTKFHVNAQSFDANGAVQYARSKGATVHVLIPDAAVSPNSLLNAKALVLANGGQDWIVAGDSLAGASEYLEGDLAVASEGKMLFSSTWDVSSAPNSPLVSFWKDDAFSRPRKVDWRTFTSYNATWIMATALNNLYLNPKPMTRGNLLKELSETGFKAVTSDKRELNFSKNTGEIDRPNITVSTVMKCGEIFTTVNFNKPICPKPKI